MLAVLFATVSTWHNRNWSPIVVVCLNLESRNAQLSHAWHWVGHFKSDSFLERWNVTTFIFNTLSQLGVPCDQQCVSDGEPLVDAATQQSRCYHCKANHGWPKSVSTDLAFSVRENSSSDIRLSDERCNCPSTKFYPLRPNPRLQERGSIFGQSSPVTTFRSHKKHSTRSCALV